MRILLINSSDTGGGASIAALRLLNALNNHGYYARMGVVSKETENPNVFLLPKKKHILLFKFSKKVIRYLNKIFNPVTKRLKKINSFKTTNEIAHSKNLITETDIKWINKSDYDVVNLHWICDVISIKDISKITKPMIWTMHDTWPFCGAEHYPNILENDQRYKYKYTRKNKPKSTKGFDLCKKIWKQKNKYLRNMNLTFISPSSWEADCLSESSLFFDKKCFVIPNIIPNEDFKKIDNGNEIRKILNIPNDKIILGFGAAYGINNPKSVKGSFYLLEALKKIEDKNKYFIIIFGNAKEEFTSQITINYLNAGFISNPKLLALLYNSCDLFICPSLIENLPNTCLEAIFCGVPVIAFNVGGTKDIVSHKENGYLAIPYNIDDLIQGIKWCSNNHNELSDNCLKKAKLDFDSNKTINSYIGAYEYVINNQ